MTRYRSYGRLDDRVLEAGDTGFVGLGTREEPTQLNGGFVSNAKNMRMDDGKATTRVGVEKILEFGATEQTEIYASRFYGGIGGQDRNQVLMLQEDKLQLWDGQIATQEDVDAGLATSVGDQIVTSKNFATIYRFPPYLPINLKFRLLEEGQTFDEILAEGMDVIQYNNQVILLQGRGKNLPINLDFFLPQPAQKWNGNTNENFVEDDSIPPGDFGIVTGNRLGIQTDADTISFSDIADESTYDVANEFRFGVGDGDDIIGMSPIPEASALIFKRRSMWAITGLNLMAVTGQSPSITQISKQTGCVSRHSIQNVGSAVFFLGDGGVYAIDIGLDASRARGTLARFDLRDEPLSKPINDRILSEDFDLAELRCRSVFFNNRYFLSFNQAEEKSTVYIYNTLIGAWESIDEYPFTITDFVRGKTKVDKKERLYIANRQGRLYRIDDEFEAEADRRVGYGTDDGTAISWELDTRAYDNQNLEVKDFRRGYAKLESLDSTGTITLSADITDPDSTRSISVARPSSEGYLDRFTVRKRGNSIKYKFSGTGRSVIKHVRTEFTQTNNNTISTKE
jgi:hypothetical protein